MSQRKPKFPDASVQPGQSGSSGPSGQSGQPGFPGYPGAEEQKDGSKNAAPALLEASGLRILQVNISAPSDVTAVNLAGRIHRLGELYLEKHWSRETRTAVALTTLTFALVDEEPSHGFHRQAKNVADQLAQYLFGETRTVEGALVEVHLFTATRPAPGHASLRRRAAQMRPAPKPLDRTRDDGSRAGEVGSHKDVGVVNKPASPSRRRRRQNVAERVGYQGVLAAHRKVLVFNEVAFRHPVRAQEILHPGPVGLSFSPGQELELLHEAARQGARAAQDNKPTLVVCPLSYETLAEMRQRAIVRGALATLADQYGAVLAVRVMMTPKDLDPEVVSAIVSSLQHGVRFVEWSTSSADVDLATLAGANIKIVSLSLPNGEPERSDALAAWSGVHRAAREHKLQTGVFGLKTESELRRAMVAGFTYLSGPAVAPLSDAPQPPQPMSTQWVRRI